MSKDDGGAAFPNITPDMPVEVGPGMSLRDYFAAKAMQAIISCTDGRSYIDSRVANDAYLMADNMLGARNDVLRKR